MEEDFSCKGHSSTEIVVRKNPKPHNKTMLIRQQLSGELINMQVVLLVVEDKRCCATCKDRKHFDWTVP